MAAGQVWGQGATQRIITGTVTEGCSLGYYSNQDCTAAVDVSNVSSGTTIYIKATPDDNHTVTAMTVTAEATVSSLVATARRRVNSGSVNIGETIEVTVISPGIFSFQMPDDDNMNVKVSATFPEKGSITPVVSISGWTYGDTANAPSVSDNPGNGTVTYTYSDAQDGTYTSVVPTEAGTYWVKAAVAMTADYYSGVSAPVSFVIAPKAVVVTITGHHSTVGWDGTEHSVSGYDFTADTNLYTESCFTFSGTALATRTDFGTTAMGLTAAQFENTSTNFDVTFNVTDGWLTVNPVITFVANGHGVAPAAQLVDIGSTATAPVAPIANGYTFSGWYTTAECTGDAYDFDNTVVNDNLTLYAKWTLTVYTITYMGVDNATFESANPTTYTMESPAITLSNPTRENRVFVGWTGTGLNVPSTEVTIPTGSTGDRTYTAKWTSTIYCLVYDETTQTFDAFSPEEFTDVTSSTTTMSEGWYAVTENVTISGRVEVTGNVHLILCDGKTLSVTQGFHVVNPATFNVYAQSEGTGVLAATSAVAVNSDTNYHRAGIGTNGNNGVREVCGDITIHGGTVTAIGGRTAAGIGGGHRGTIGTIAIRGGHVTAIGFDCSSGIGNGKNDEGSSSVQSTYQGTVIITGGTVESKGHIQAIGAGFYSPSTNLQLGDMKVYSSANATIPVEPSQRLSTCRSGYARLEPCTEHNWIENSCTLCGAANRGVAYSRNNATGGTAPVDATNYTDGQTVTVLGNTGNLERTGYTFAGWNTAADGKGTNYAADDTFTFSGDVTLYAKWVPITYTISYDLNGGRLTTANPTSYTADDDDFTLVNPTLDGMSFAGWTGTGLEEPTETVTIAKGSTGDRSYTANWQPILEYQAYNTTTQEFETLTAPAYTVVTSSTTAMNNRWYVVTEDVTVSSRIEATGTVHLILCDGKTLTAKKGIRVPSGVTLNIYGQSAGTGQITISNVDNDNAGIGGNYHEDGGSVTIDGGVVTTLNGYYAAGIGGGLYGHGGAVTIHGGTVTATSREGAAGIGGGYYGNSGTVTITGGTVTATGGSLGGAGIGGGYYGNGGTATITGGTVTATGGSYGDAGGAGIGGGNNGSGGAVTITGGTVIAKAGNSNAQAIGRGRGSKESGSLTLGDMKVYASADATDPVATASRESTCRTTYAKLIACAEHQWVENTCTWCGATCQGVVYGRNNATSGTAPVDVTNYTDGQTVTVLGNTGNLERTGYTFVGWNTAADGSGTDYAADDTFTYSGDVTIYAKWAPITYTISYDGVDGATFASANPTSYTADDDFTLVNPTHNDMVFAGWTGTGLEGLTKTVTIAKGSTGDREYTANWQPRLEYLAYNTTTQEFETLTKEDYVTVSASTTAMSNGWYAVRSNVTVDSRIEVTGTVNLILCDGATLTAPKGLHVKSGVTLNIYGQTNGTGKVAISGVENYLAGIGGNSQENGGTVVIHGGNVTTTGGINAAGIGGGYCKSGQAVAIYGGTVTANGGEYGAGIGGGEYKGAGCSSVVITGGTVNATGVNGGAGIGGGWEGNGGGTVVITGGTVNATGGSCSIYLSYLGAGIGGGYNGAGCSSVSISGGIVTAQGGSNNAQANAQAIGRGYDSSGSDGDLTLGDMKVYASANATDPVASASRESTCHTTYAKLMLCTEHNNSDGVCTYCSASLITLTLAPAGYGTYYNGESDVTLPTGVIARIVTAKGSSEGTLVYETIADGDGDGTEVKNTIPAGTAVMLYSEGGGNRTLTLSETDIDSRTFSNNLLHGSDTETETIGGAVFYKLTYGSEKGHENIFGWYWGADGGAAFLCPAHKAWLALPQGSRAFIALPDDADEIRSLTPGPSRGGEGSIYTLDGVKLDKMPTRKGLYIRNGRKIIIK